MNADVLAYIGSFETDIDARRVLGGQPRRLPVDRRHALLDAILTKRATWNNGRSSDIWLVDGPCCRYVVRPTSATAVVCHFWRTLTGPTAKNLWVTTVYRSGNIQTANYSAKRAVRVIDMGCEAFVWQNGRWIPTLKI
jgi:hypothetical protein